MTKKNWLKSLRSDANLSQDELAARLQLAGQDYSRSSVNSWENGYTFPPLKNPSFRQALSDALNIDVQSLLRAAGFEIDSEHSEYATRIASIIDKLPERKQRQILHIVETFIEE